MTKRATMIDVAQRAGVSQATVSLVMNGVSNPRVSQATRARVMEAAEELGYRKGPRHNVPEHRRPVIGLLIDEVMSTPFAMPFIEGARDEAALQDVIVATFCTRSDPKLENAALDLLFEMNVIGILYTTLTTRQVVAPDRLSDMPTVLMNCYEKQRRHPSVVPGDVAGGHAATDALLRAGHRRIAHLKGEEWIEAAQDREKGYRQALTTWDVPIDEELILTGGWTVDGGRALTTRLLDSADPPTAIFCFNDRMAVGAYDAIKSRGLRVPEDISVVGFDDEDLASYMVPPLSTVLLPHDEMARWAVGTLLDQNDGISAHRSAQRVKIECPLIERGSIHPVPSTERG
ncbi:LacI family DNA-binding transcriptional regulator (plasmid) [Rhizobium grahamii]|uniref:LacI family DNA-binding transcriptional regulator n=1 Tax=Rhizobium grahamii TaxID=1120045 RepID=A0A5Q0CHH8_9HYPH|nr:MULTISPECIES: LacI family DNA-binding transcriptional regulator [Rhizobium]QFY63980.1 LacI family DNA-binding transcriptional regulator [Rhizobium grahamii]QRM52776.1 LacI family DNA-binding transcriptional regulator [Rhizobium sp. BG6]